MSNFSKLYRIESEQLHNAMFGIHRDLFQGALHKIGKALMVLHSVEGHQDLRNQARSYIQEFEKLRTDLELIGYRAADFRTKLIQENGCDGNCS